MTFGALLGPSVLLVCLVGGLRALAAILALLVRSLGDLVGPALTLTHCTPSMTTGPLDPRCGIFFRDLPLGGGGGGGSLLEILHNRPALYSPSLIDDPRGWVVDFGGPLP